MTNQELMETIFKTFIKNRLPANISRLSGDVYIRKEGEEALCFTHRHVSCSDGWRVDCVRYKNSLSKLIRSYGRCKTEGVEADIGEMVKDVVAWMEKQS